MSPIAAVGAKALQPVAGIVGDAIASQVSSTVPPGFQRELLRGTGRSEEFAMPVDHELLALCSAERQQQFGNSIQGHTVQVSSPKGQILTGRVDKVWMENNQLHFEAAGETFSIGDLRAIYQNPPPSARSMTPQQSVTPSTGANS